MQYILTESEYNTLLAATRPSTENQAQILHLTARLQQSCLRYTLLAKHDCPLITPKTQSTFCDYCPIQDLCPHPDKVFLNPTPTHPTE